MFINRRKRKAYVFGIDIMVVKLADTYLYQLKSSAICTQKI